MCLPANRFNSSASSFRAYTFVTATPAYTRRPFTSATPVKTRWDLPDCRVIMRTASFKFFGLPRISPAQTTRVSAPRTSSPG